MFKGLIAAVTLAFFVGISNPVMAYTDPKPEDVLQKDRSGIEGLMWCQESRTAKKVYTTLTPGNTAASVTFFREQTISSDVNYFMPNCEITSYAGPPEEEIKAEEVEFLGTYDFAGDEYKNTKMYLIKVLNLKVKKIDGNSGIIPVAYVLYFDVK